MKNNVNFNTFIVLILSFLAQTAHTMDELEIVNECPDESIFSSIPENLKGVVRHNERGSYIDRFVKADFTDDGMPLELLIGIILPARGKWRHMPPQNPTIPPINARLILSAIKSNS